MVWTLCAAAALGVLSRVEERMHGFDIGISSNPTWLALAFVAGALATDLRTGAIRGALALTVANASYYAFVHLTEDHSDMALVWLTAERWFALGIAAGLVMGAAGSALKANPIAVRIAAALLPAAVIAADAAGAFDRILPY